MTRRDMGEFLDPHDRRPVRVWDPLVRLAHWGLVICVVLNAWVLEEGELAHRRVGYAACTLVLVRGIWGIVGTRHARFSSFFPTPARLQHQLQAMQRGQVQAYVGHSPLGAVMMLALMGLVLLLGLTGWMQGLDAFFGDEWLEELHKGVANTLLACAGLHAMAALVLGRLERVALVRAMVTGIKQQH